MSPDDQAAEIIRLRERLHHIVDSTAAQLRSLEAEIYKLSVHVERELAIVKEQNRGLADKLDDQAKDTTSLRRGVYTLAFSAIGIAVTTLLAAAQVFQ